MENNFTTFVFCKYIPSEKKLFQFQRILTVAPNSSAVPSKQRTSVLDVLSSWEPDMNI